jgi:hypothetical protein
MTQIETVKALLRGKFARVGQFRLQQPRLYRLLPGLIHHTSERFLTNGAGDNEGRQVLSRWLQENPQ